ncbi:hypothetical protein A9165_13380 [Alishewanella sp. HH-ZS]|nr:hypothetical protein A9165_13380 [Alishewanella sp. HH-ZS]
MATERKLLKGTIQDGCEFLPRSLKNISGSLMLRTEVISLLIPKTMCTLLMEFMFIRMMRGFKTL